MTVFACSKNLNFHFLAHKPIVPVEEPPMIDPSKTHPLLRELNDALAIEGAEPVNWIVCGGTALGILGLVRRPTRDVDVIGAWSAEALQVIQLDRFPPPVERAIARVADAHPELRSSGISWVNLGPKGLLNFGLPPGCTDRLAPRSIGTHLTLQLPDRLDLIAFKVFAAIEAAHERRKAHKEDLQVLTPNEKELQFAIDWVVTIPDRNHQLRAELREFLQELGHEDLAYYVA
jgi:hypothetical protein